MKNKANKKLREAMNRKGKDKHMRKRTIQNEVKGARRRSFALLKTKKKRK